MWRQVAEDVLRSIMKDRPDQEKDLANTYAPAHIVHIDVVNVNIVLPPEPPPSSSSS